MSYIPLISTTGNLDFVSNIPAKQTTANAGGESAGTVASLFNDCGGDSYSFSTGSSSGGSSSGGSSCAGTVA